MYLELLFSSFQNASVGKIYQNGQIKEPDVKVVILGLKKCQSVEETYPGSHGSVQQNVGRFYVAMYHRRNSLNLIKTRDSTKSTRP